jgi:NADH-quinone oxidoreductase subunit F
VEEHRLLFEGIDVPDVDRLVGYSQRGGGQGIARALQMSSEAVVDEVSAAGLRGRGGAWRSVGERWQTLQRRGGARYLVVDLLEPEPGRFRDRKLAERQPHRLLEGVRIAAHATGGSVAFLCIRADASRARQSLSTALDELREAGQIGGGGLQIHLHVVPGALPVAAGDSLPLELVEGGRPEPRADDGRATTSSTLFGEPAAVHTASSLGFLPFILTEGSSAFRALGSAATPGTQAFCISGHVRRPGLYEVPLGGGTFGDLVEGLAGGVRQRQRLKFVLHAGYGSVPVLTPDGLDRPLDPGAWSDPDDGELSGRFGSGVVIVADDTVCAVDTALQVARSFADTACAKCLPCREQSSWAAEALARLEAGDSDADELELLRARSARLRAPLAMCGHGPLGAAAVGALQAEFEAEFEAHLEGVCPIAKDLSLKSPESIHVRF